MSSNNLESIRTQFLEYVEQNKNESYQRVYKSIIKRLSEFEDSIDKHVSTMSRAELDIVLPLVCGVSYSIRSMLLSLLKEYINWCIANNVEGASTQAIDTMSVGDIDPSRVIQYQLVKDWTTLDHIIFESFSNHGKSDYLAYQAHLLAWLAFNGCTISDVSQLKKADVKPAEHTISIGEKTLENVPEFIFETIDRLNHFAYVSVYQKNSKEREWKLEDNEYVIRRIVPDNAKRIVQDEDFKKRQLLISKQLFKAFCYLNKSYYVNTNQIIELTYTRVFESGQFYKLYQLEQSGQSIDYKVIQSMFNLKHQTAITKYGDYQAWKKAFSL